MIRSENNLGEGGGGINLPALLAAARRPDASGSRLLELYVERCYKLAAESYDELERLDRAIAELGRSGG